MKWRTSHMHQWLLSIPTTTFESFELSTVTIKFPHFNLDLLALYNINLLQNLGILCLSLEDFWTLILSASTSSHEFLITGDFNIHVDDLAYSNTIQFLLLLDHAHLTQHIFFPTHRHSYTLEVVITSANSTLSPTVNSLPNSPTDPFPIICSLKIPNSVTSMTNYLTRAIHAINISEFCYDILSSRLIIHPPSTLAGLVNC